MNVARMEGPGELPRAKPWTLPGALVVRTVAGAAAAAPVEGARVRFGRGRPDDPDKPADVTVGADDKKISRQHGLLVHRQGWWYLSNTGKLPVEVGEYVLRGDGESVPLRAGVTSVLITTPAGRHHVVELYVNGGDGALPPPLFGQHTAPGHVWSLSERERLVLAVLGQEYLRNNPRAQPIGRNQAATQLAELRPEDDWNVRKMDRVVEAVRLRLSRKGVFGLVEADLPQPIGNLLSHNLLSELIVRTPSITHSDLMVLEDDD
ncbi:FHA domain-containing protein [Allokutzneria sp. A3M-2-11 16]|uniref:FHA domain-containing protein n=1 Tax=Allokutzneria sp. A3M-2-11 16 TaxID=2962043 RepID=UPI0020B709F0|nr:FHA domain-containing protein [Allokutzneria sp. A3M-2-11 16]MCP3803740.1 FHA domain-containing protein [Allokutzneria sp. A3M-2-11 16]